jgi:hypothetical protein
MVLLLYFSLFFYSLFLQALLQADSRGCEQGHEHLLRERRVLQLPDHQVHGEPGGCHRQARGQQAHRVGQGGGTLQHHPGTVRIVYQCCGSGIRCLFDLRDPGWVKKIRIWIRDEQPGSYFRELRNHFFGIKYLYSLMRIQDGKN